jgi:GntR family transcriptional regulator/MocR family aminotransferase
VRDSSPRQVLATLGLDKRSETPLYQQLYQAVRAAVLRGLLKPGSRLPSTRGLSRDLDVSRNTIVNAFDQLAAEGYLDGKAGSGTFVCGTLRTASAAGGAALSARERVAPSRLSRRGEAMAQMNRQDSRRSAFITGFGSPRPFIPGPALDVFPRDLWSRIESRFLRKAPSSVLGYGQAAGYRALREALAEYLGRVRGVHAEPDQIIVSAGTQQAAWLVGQLLLDPGDVVWLEDPGYPAVRRAFERSRVKIVPVPVDDEGLDVEAGIARDENPKLISVTPSHHCPLGVTMSLTRRLQLLSYAANTDAWILEDDYDSEYRFVGRPLASLQGLSDTGRVIYAGTFSKVLFPSLRLGYVVVPPALVDPFIAARATIDRQCPTIPQAVLAEFLNAGHFERHIRRMRSLYGERQAVLLEASDRHCRGLLDVSATESGLNTIGWLPSHLSGHAAASAAQRENLLTLPLSAFALEPVTRDGLVLGFGGCAPQSLRSGVAKLARALATLAARPASESSARHRRMHRR